MPRPITMPLDEATASFGSGLRWWRERRGFSQLLATATRSEVARQRRSA